MTLGSPFTGNTGNAVAADIKKTVTEHREDISEAQLSEIEDFLEDQGIYGNKDAYLTLGDLYLSGILNRGIGSACNWITNKSKGTGKQRKA